MVSFKKLSLHLDIANAFLYGNLEEDEYVQMRQPEGLDKKFADDGTPLICLVTKSLYGLKSAPKIWQKTLEKELRNLSFEKSSVDPGVWYSKNVILWV